MERSPVVFFVQGDARSPLTQLAAGQTWQLRDLRAHEVAGAMPGVLAQTPAPVAAVIDAGVAQPVTIARRIAETAPLCQFIFVSSSAEREALHGTLRKLPLIGAHWTVLAREHPDLARQVQEQVKLGQQRRRHRTTLDHVNQQLRTREQVDPRRLHRLVSSERYLATIVTHSPDAIVTLGTTAQILSWNHGAERLWGCQTAEAVGRDLRDFFAPQPEGDFSAVLDAVARTRDPSRCELFAAHRDGGGTPVEITLAPVLDEGGGLVAFSLIARDITDRKAAEAATNAYNATLERVVTERTAQLQETIAQLEQFSYTVSHDLRGPLRAMHGYAEILQEELASGGHAELRRYAERIARAADRMDRLVQDVLSYSRIATVKLEKHPVDVDVLVHEIVAHLPEEVRRRSTIVIEGKLPTLRTHSALLGQVFGNFINNALKFVPAGKQPRVRIWAKRGERKVTFFVADEGIGIAPAFRAKIFGMFERGVGPNAYDGTGIGLAIVKKSVERLGGTVGFESEEGKGSTFWFELPEA